MWPFRKKQVSLTVERPKAVPSVLEELEPLRRYTPDMARLEMYEYHYLFVCGEMQAGHHQQEQIALDERTGWEAFTQLDFHFLMNDLGVMSHPLLFPQYLPDNMWKLPKLPVKGEIVRLKPRRFLELDNYYHNTVRFIRLPVMLVVPFTKLLFNDRRIAENLFPISKPADDNNPLLVGGARQLHEKRKKVNAPRQTAAVSKHGVYRVWAQCYFAPTTYWYELISSYNNPPIKTFSNPNGIVKEYSRFTIDQYDPPF